MISVLKHLVESLVGEVLAEAKKPEAPKDSLAGEYLWADPEQQLRKDGVEEPDTTIEKKVLAGLRSWYVNAFAGSIKKILPFIDAFIAEGYFDKYFTPPKRPVYRYLSNLTPDVASSLLGIPVDEIFSQPNQIVTLDFGGVISSKQEFSSWSIDPTLEDMSAYTWPRKDYVSILLKASPQENKFLLNPTELVKTFEPDFFSEFLEKEMEVIGVGDIEFDKAAFWFPTEKVKNIHTIEQALAYSLL